MNKAAIVLCCSLLLANSPASAGLFADDDARKQIKQLEEQIHLLEGKLSTADEQNKQSVRALLDLQTQIEAQASELRNLRGQNEEWAHSLQDVEKRQKDFYVDLDARLRQVETGAQSVTQKPAANLAEVAKTVSANQSGEGRAFEIAYGLYKAENYANAAIAFRDFLRQFPQSSHEANVYYWMGNAYFATKEYQDALDSYQNLVAKYQDHPRVAEAMLNMAESQVGLKNKIAAKKLFKQIVTQFPGSDAADKAKKRFASLK